jgi:hypothetical protein
LIVQISHVWHVGALRGGAIGGPLRRHGDASRRCPHRRPAERNEGECGRDQHESTTDKQRHVQAVDEGAVRERLGGRAELLRDNAALSTTYVLDDIRGTRLS